MNWLKEILFKISNYDTLSNDKEEVEDELEALKTSSSEEIKLLTETLALSIVEADDFRLENQALNDKLQSLNKELDILSLKSWYEGRRKDGPWKYDGARLKDIDVKYYLRTMDEDTMVEASKLLISKYKLTSGSKPETILKSLMKYFILRSNWTYYYDKALYNKEDYWQDAAVSWDSRKGDCDDLAILMHVLWDYILRELDMSEHYWRLTFAAGQLLGEGGHAFNTYLHSDGEYYVVESTYDIKGSYYRAWLNTPVRFNNMYVNFYGFANKDKSWGGGINALSVYSS